MSHHYFRGDDRKLAVLSGVGFQPIIPVHRGRTAGQAVLHIKGIMKARGFSSSIDFGRYIIANAKGDSVSTSRILSGATFGQNKFQIECPGQPYYFEFRKDGSIGAPLADPGLMVGQKAYYILNSIVYANSDYVAIGTKTPTQEATFFTDIPPEWISSAT